MCVCVLSFLGYITWNSVERRSVMARTADIQVNANKGRTTHELHREALPEKVGERGGGGGFREERGWQEKQNRRFRSQDFFSLSPLMPYFGTISYHSSRER